MPQFIRLDFGEKYILQKTNSYISLSVLKYKKITYLALFSVILHYAINCFIYNNPNTESRYLRVALT